jgi:hypothetical protein
MACEDMNREAIAKMGRLRLRFDSRNVLLRGALILSGALLGIIVGIRSGLGNDSAPTERQQLASVYDLGPNSEAVGEAARDETRVLEMASVVDEYVRDVGGTDFAGMYLSHEEGKSFLNVGFIRAWGRHEDAIRSEVSDPDRIRIFDAEYSLRALRDLQHRISEDTADLSKSDIQVTEISLDQERNQVIVGITAVTESAQEEFASRYGIGMYELAEIGYSSISGSSG